MTCPKSFAESWELLVDVDIWNPRKNKASSTTSENAFEGFGGVIFSGGTAKYNKANGEKSFMVTALPVILAEDKENIKVLGSFPRTDVFRLADGEKGMANLVIWWRKPKSWRKLYPGAGCDVWWAYLPFKVM
jgi:hypothetical protein